MCAAGEGGPPKRGEQRSLLLATAVESFRWPEPCWESDSVKHRAELTAPPTVPEQRSFVRQRGKIKHYLCH